MAEGTSDNFASALRREIMRSEVQRMQVLAIVLTVLLAATLGALNLAPEFAERLFRKTIEPWTPLAGVGPFVVYEWGALRVLRWRMARDLDFPRVARFANALIETSLPSVVIFELSLHMEPATVLGFWPPMLYFLFIVLSTLRLDFWLSMWTGAVAAAQQFALAAYLMPIQLFSDLPEHSLVYHLSRSIVLLGAGVIAGIVAGSLRRQFAASVAASAAHDRVTNLFGQHVSPAVVERLLAQQSDPPSEMRRVCVLFLDIRGFTAMTRVRAADETVALLNDFFAGMIEIVDRHHGIINKFLGDGFLALFGAPLEDPRAAANALAAARGMLKAVDAWNGARPRQPLRIGIGIHIGDAVTGTVGSPQRKEYTVIGDTVNLAARLEQLTKETGSQLLISGSVYADTAGADGATDLGPLPIRGYGEPVQVWRVA
ncbi:adenylate/guanylate cyclase domain-containing protein [Reyranella sp.]|uniref:adenylate/guanylate cyclase domain-containing protein n=1 Tax=Reyranella sp. TaxID=1929291 RepID=UPI003783B26B